MKLKFNKPMNKKMAVAAVFMASLSSKAYAAFCRSSLTWPGGSDSASIDCPSLTSGHEHVCECTVQNTYSGTTIVAQSLKFLCMDAKVTETPTGFTYSGSAIVNSWSAANIPNSFTNCEYVP